jgi:hypothetical protein
MNYKETDAQRGMNSSGNVLSGNFYSAQDTAAPPGIRGTYTDNTQNCPAELARPASLEEAGSIDDSISTFLTQPLKDQIHLVVIPPDGTPEGKDFSTNADTAIKWSKERNDSGGNIYYTVNAVRPGTNKKPLKSDIAGVRFGHVDIDPPKDGSAWNPQDTLKELMNFSAPPSFVVWSGNGWQALWRVRDSSLEQVEEINKALILRFGGDKGTWNADRLFRLPGFINYPNKKSAKPGVQKLMHTSLALIAAVATPSLNSKMC